MATAKKAPSVKSVCEENILKGRKKGVIMNTLRKKFSDKPEETLEKSLKYYASALHREGKIDDAGKALYVGARGKPATKDNAKTSKTSKSSKPAAKSKAKTEKTSRASKSKTAKKSSDDKKSTRRTKTKK